MPNFCGFWPESFCGSAAIMSNLNLETELFLFLTRRAWAPTAAAPSLMGVWAGGSRAAPARDGARQGGAEVPGGPWTPPQGNAPRLLACFMAASWAAETIPWRTAGTGRGLCTRGPSRYPCRGTAHAYIFVFIYLTAVGLPPPALSVLEWVTALCFSVEKTSRPQKRGGWLPPSFHLTTSYLKHPVPLSSATSAHK